MTAERVGVWLAAIACAAVTWVGATGAVPMPPDRTVLVVLAVVGSIPIALVVLAWLSSFRARQRGWT